MTQSIKKLSNTLKAAIFNDYDYKLLSTDKPISIASMKAFDVHDSIYAELCQDKAYKIIIADKAIDLGFYEEKYLPTAKSVK